MQQMDEQAVDSAAVYGDSRAKTLYLAKLSDSQTKGKLGATVSFPLNHA